MAPMRTMATDQRRWFDPSQGTDAAAQAMRKMEMAMAERIAGQSGLSVFEGIIRSIAGWVRLWRIAFGTRNELAVASPEEVAQIAIHVETTFGRL